MLTQKRLKELLTYSPITGEFTHNQRDETHNRHKSFNSRLALKKAGCPDTYGYISIRLDKRLYLAHRLVFLYMYGGMPINQVDHINQIRDDNRLANLQEATHQENHQNRTLNKNNDSGFCGVDWHKASGRWRARINTNGINIVIGYFKNKGEAIKARKKANKRYGYHANHGSRKNG